MPALRGRRQLTALLGYACVSIAFSWPLPLRLSTALPGPASGDTGVYVWNLWVFSYELLNGRFPFSTLEILSLTPPVPLTLHNYTTAANIVAIPLLRMFSTVATFNVIAIASMVLAAFAMFLFARRVADDDAAGWIAGLLFGFSPFISARLGAHVSLVQAAPLPIFALLLHRLATQPSIRIAVGAGAVVAWAFLSDPYYAVYCVLMAGYLMVYSVVTVRRSASGPVALAWRASLDVALICLAGLIAGIAIRGGGRFDVLGITVSINRLYTPILVLTVLLCIRLWLVVRPRIALTLPPLKRPIQLIAAASITCIAVLFPVLSAMALQLTERAWISPKVLWRSSPAGVDVLAFFVPSPLHPLWGGLFGHSMLRIPGEIVENTASLSWVAFAVLVLAVAVARTRLPRYWVAFTAFFGLLALGPFVQIAGVPTYVPTPWCVLRYVPVLGAARMPTRFSIMVMFGLAILTAIALRDLRQQWRRPGMTTAIVAVLLLVELTPAPREVHSARVPSVYSIIAADSRPVRIIQLPIGLRDGMNSYGNHNAEYQFFQTVHHKPLIGGYMSRLPKNEIEAVRQFRLMRVLLDMSSGVHISDERIARATLTARATVEEMNVGYVVINTTRTSKQLRDFALNAMGLMHIASDGPIELYKTSLHDTRHAASDQDR